MKPSGSTALRMRPVSLIGEGSRGEVFVGIDEVLRRRVIIKKLAATSYRSADDRRRLIEEAKVLARLDHPNILRIHDYTEQDGFDVFTFEFTPGSTLSTALAERLDFPKKVRIATAVASALVVAHRNGIVHGALSPDSVLLGESGDIKLTDFASTTTRLDGPRAEPRWRSPEETRGEEPTRTSDMYAFGLLLREMFGERDHDVRALTASLLIEVPSERSTAAVALARLHRIGHRRARRLRSGAVALTVALFLFGGAKYTVDLRRERSAAVAAQAEAEARRKQANELVVYMIEDIRPKLLSVGRLEIIDSATDKALAYFASFTPEEISPDDASVHVQALVQLSQNQLIRADLPAARKTVGRAITLAEAALRRRPEDLEVRFAAGNAHAMLSNALDRGGDLAGALTHARAYAEACNDLVRRKPEEIKFLRHQAYAYSLLATLYGRRDDNGAELRDLETAIDVKRRIVTLDNSDESRLEVGITIHKAGLALLKLGRFREAQATLEAERANLETLFARKSTHWRMRELLARYDDDLVAVTFATGDVPASLRLSASHLAISQQLAAFDPDNIDWKRQLIIAHRSAGTAARMTGDLDSALRHHAAAVDLLSGIFVRGRQTNALVWEMSMCRAELARSLLADGRAHTAAIQAGLAIETLQPVRSELPSQRFVADALLVRGEALAAGGDLAGASAAWEEALPVVEAVDVRSPDPRVADTHARILLRLGRNGRATPLIEELSALGYRNREFEALCKEKGAFVQS